MQNPKALRYQIGNVAVADHIQVKRAYFFRGPVPFTFEAVLCNGADGTAGAVLEDDTGNLVGKLNNLFDLLRSGEWCPFHGVKAVAGSQNAKPRHFTKKCSWVWKSGHQGPQGNSSAGLPDELNGSFHGFEIGGATVAFVARGHGGCKGCKNDCDEDLLEDALFHCVEFMDMRERDFLTNVGQTSFK